MWGVKQELKDHRISIAHTYGSEGQIPASAKGQRRYTLLHLPFTIVERTHIPGFKPSRDTVEVESVLQDQERERKPYASARDEGQCKPAETHVTDSPSSVALLGGRRDLIRLAVDAYRPS